MSEPPSILPAPALTRSPGTAAMPVTLVFGAVFLLVMACAIVLTSKQARIYAGTAKIKLAGSPNTAEAMDASHIKSGIETILSASVLGKAVEELDLNRLWGNAYPGGTVLKTSEAIPLLRARLRVVQIRDTPLVGITVYDESPLNAAAFANGIARAYLEHAKSGQDEGGHPSGLNSQASLAVAAIAPARPCRPNLLLNLTVGAAAGIVLGFIGAILARLILPGMPASPDSH